MEDGVNAGSFTTEHSSPHQNIVKPIEGDAKVGRADCEEQDVRGGDELVGVQWTRAAECQPDRGQEEDAVHS